MTGQSAASGAGPRIGSTTLAVILLTFNEARHVARAIASVRGIASDILVVDSFSTDDTVAIAEAAGARVLAHPFVNQAKQFQWALDQGGISTGWIMRLDADEIIEADLADEIARELPRLAPNVVGVNFKRKHIFMDRWIRHGGRYPLVMLRLWRNGHGRIEDRWMDEHMIVWGGRTVTFEGGFADHSLHDLGFFTDKHNRYATREAIDRLSRHYGLFPEDTGLSVETASRQAGVKRWIKTRLYDRLPFWAGPLAYFLYRYIGQLGILDGRPGLIYHFLQGFWYRFLVGAKVVELDRSLAACPDNDSRIATLSRLTGYDLAAIERARAPAETSGTPADLAELVQKR